MAPGGPARAAPAPAPAGIASRRARPLAPTAMNHVWAYDFVFDTCADGRSLKCLTVVDEFTRECLAIDVAGSIRSGRVIDVLGQLVSLHGPRALRGPIPGRSSSRPLCSAGCRLPEIDTAFIDPGKPWQNGTDESFNGKFRNECLSLEWFWNADGGLDRDRTLAATPDNENVLTWSRRPHPREFKKSDGDDPRLVGESLKRFSNRPCTTWGGRGTSAATDAGGPIVPIRWICESALLDSDAGMKAADVAVEVPA